MLDDVVACSLQSDHRRDDQDTSINVYSFLSLDDLQNKLEENRDADQHDRNDNIPKKCPGELTPICVKHCVENHVLCSTCRYLSLPSGLKLVELYLCAVFVLNFAQLFEVHIIAF